MPLSTSIFSHLFASSRNEFWDSDYMDDSDCCGGQSSTMFDESYGHDEDLEYNIFTHVLNTSSSTASRKSFLLNADVSSESHREWTTKELRYWSPTDIMNWIISVAETNDYEYERIQMQSFNVDGLALASMTETEFQVRAPGFGDKLYLSLQSIIAPQCSYTHYHMVPPFSYSFEKPTSHLPTLEEAHTLTDLNAPNEESSYDLVLSDTESIPSPTLPPLPVRRPPGRPRGTRTKKPEKRCGRLWEFIRDLLLNREYCPSLICWDDHENGVFRFVHSEKVANLWGTIKENPRMTYEKLSRAMRYYYKSKVLQPVLGRRLVYKFGPTATGWRTPNPNFRNPE